MAYLRETANREFDHWSKTYDRSWLQWMIFHPSHELLLSQLRASDERLLDVGCGTSQFLSRAVQAHPGLSAVGLDLSAKMLDQGRERVAQAGQQVVVVRGDSERLPFADNTFDVVTCCHSFHHYPRQAAAVVEMYRVLRPEGRLLLIDGDRDRLWGWLVFDVAVTTIEGGVHHCSGRELRELFRLAGFAKVEQISRRGIAPFLLTMGVAAKQSRAFALPVSRAA
jgi:SAM-dependent methyltransferase